MVFDQFHNGFFEFTGFPPEAVFPGIETVDFVSRVISRIGYDADTVSASKRERIEAIIQPGLGAVQMSGIGRMADIDAWDAKGLSGGGLEIKSPQWAGVVSRMITPRRLICFVLTLGESFERLKQGRALFDVYVLDGLGSELIETAAEMAEQRLAVWAGANSMACSRRFSPGYCDWPLASGQKALFDFLNPAAIGVGVLSTGAMRPSKSISAVVLTADQVPLICPCRFCPQKDCDHRRL